MEQLNLWEETSQTSAPPTKDIINKLNNQKKVEASDIDVSKYLKSDKVNLKDKIALIKEKVYATLGKQIDNVVCIYTKEDLLHYLDLGIEAGRVAIDTETNNSIDTTTCKLMGLCLYVDGEKQAYIPVNHVNIDTGERLSNQLTEQDITDSLNYLIKNKGDTQFIYHNGKFDLEVLQTTCGVKLPIDWDTMIAAQMLDENEKSFNLKEQYITKIDPTQEKYSIENLFEGLPYEYFDPELFSLYAATDAMLTDKLYAYQLNQFFETPELVDVYSVYKEVEIPLIPVIVDMELRGVQFDLNYNEILKTKYYNLLNKCDEEIQKELANIQDKIDAWRQTPEANTPLPTTSKTKTVGKTKNEQLSDPILLSSPTQLAILFYDILKEPVIDSASPRGTGEEILKKMNNNIAQLMTTRRGIYKLITSFIDSLPQKVGEDGKIHCEFNQMGARTGRFSSENPNLQQIPSHNKELRMQFKGSERFEVIEKENNSFIVPQNNWVYTGAKWECIKNLKAGATVYENKGSENIYIIVSTQPLGSKIKILVSETASKTLYTKVRYILVSSDFSQQEPRMLSQFSQDENMIKAYQDGKDIYATIASGIYNNKYEDNLEFYADGTPNPEGKTRRASVKSLLLGIMYGRGVYSIADEFGGSIANAQKIVDNFYKAYPKVKKWVEETENGARKNGYVCDMWGRRRRLPNIQLPKIEATEVSSSEQFNPFLICEDRKETNPLVETYRVKAEKAKNKKELEKISQEAIKKGVEIKNNGGLIAEAERQCVNARIQGSSATMTKKAMIKIYNDKRLQDLDFHLLIVVHDELIGECPYENAEAASEILCEDMRNCLKDDKRIDFQVPFKCDPDVSFNWYWNDYINSLKEDFNKLCQTKDKNTAFDEIKNEHIEVNENILKEELLEA